jgi:hypothetical protein
MFVIEDEAHAEPQGEFAAYEGAVAELRRRASIAWDLEPNRCPCTAWRTCGRRYEIIEYDPAVSPRREVRRVPALEISARGVEWHIPCDAPLGAGTLAPPKP